MPSGCALFYSVCEGKHRLDSSSGATAYEEKFDLAGYILAQENEYWKVSGLKTFSQQYLFDQLGCLEVRVEEKTGQVQNLRVMETLSQWLTLVQRVS